MSSIKRLNFFNEIKYRETENNFSFKDEIDILNQNLKLLKAQENVY